MRRYKTFAKAIVQHSPIDMPVVELLFLYNLRYTLFVNFCVDFIRIVC